MRLLRDEAALNFPPRICTSAPNAKPLTLESKSHKHRLRLQHNSPRALHASLNRILQFHDVARPRVPAIDQRQRMLARNPRLTLPESFPKPRMLHQPSRRNFPGPIASLCVQRRVTRNLQPLRFRPRRQPPKFSLPQHRILKERPPPRSASPFAAESPALTRAPRQATASPSPPQTASASPHTSHKRRPRASAGSSPAK